MSEPQRYTLALPDISYGMDESNKGEYVLWRDYAKLKAEVERLKKEKELPFAFGGVQLLVDLNKLLTAHRYYCDVNAIDYRQMEKDALS